MQVYIDADVPTDQPCGACEGTGTIRIKNERHVVQFYGALYGGQSATCLRIQRNPTAKDKVPIAYASHLVEDTATARPISKSEIAQSAFEQLATAHNQFLDSKSLNIRRPWKKQIGSPSFDVDCNAPNGVIPWESSENEANRTESSAFDDGVTLLPYMNLEEKEIQDIFGANDTIVGEISSGRRPASEINLANQGSMRPLVNLIDQFNHDMFGHNGWGGFALDNMEVWGDRDWFLKRTGRPVWGKLELYTAVGEEMLKKQALLANGRYILELAGSNPALQPLIPKILQQMLPEMGLKIDPSILDQGMRKAQADGMKIVAKILGDGVPLMPSQDDPHEIFVQIFSEALRSAGQSLAANDGEDYWATHAPQNLPLLAQRLGMQQQLLLQQQMQQMQAQLAQASMQSQAENSGRPDPRGNQPKRPNEPPATEGRRIQNEQGNNNQ